MVQFSPPLAETKTIMINCLKEIVENTQKFPRIEKEIFPEYQESELFLLEVTWGEDYVQGLGTATRHQFNSHVDLHLVTEAEQIFESNTVGPRTYVQMYQKYRDILTGQSLDDKEDFLKSEASLDQFRERMLRYANLRDEISHIRKVVMLNLFGLVCSELNQVLLL